MRFLNLERRKSYIVELISEQLRNNRSLTELLPQGESSEGWLRCLKGKLDRQTTHLWRCELIVTVTRTEKPHQIRDGRGPKGKSWRIRTPPLSWLRPLRPPSLSVGVGFWESNRSAHLHQMRSTAFTEQSQTCVYQELLQVATLIMPTWHFVKVEVIFNFELGMDSLLCEFFSYLPQHSSHSLTLGSEETSTSSFTSQYMDSWRETVKSD